MKTLILVITLILTGCYYIPVNDYQTDTMRYQQQRNNDLYMQSGSTGCTPNFSTGQCR